jgi:CheY-like chemotaxis protein
MAMQARKIMVIDDEPISNLITRKMLLRNNPEHLLIEYTEPGEALANIAADNPDAIFLDLNMPQMNGWEFIEVMNERQITRPIVLLTSSINYLDVEQSKQYAEVIHYQAKPLNLAAIEEIMQKI